MTNPVQATIVSQVSAAVFVKRGEILLVDDETVRFRLSASLNVNVRYDVGSDLYEVTTNRMTRDYRTKTERASGVYAEDLAGYFPKSRQKDENVRAFLSQVRRAVDERSGQ